MQKNILNRWVFIIATLVIAILLLINDYQYYSSNPDCEPFTDSNNNGKWDPGEVFTDLGNGEWDLGENFRDCNETGSICDGDAEWTPDKGNGKWDKGEVFTDLGNGKCDCNKAINDFLFDSSIINLGLDLRGGVEYLLSPKIDKWLIENNQAKDDKHKETLTKIIKEFKNNSDANTFDIATLENGLEGTGTTISDLFPGETKESLENSINEALESNKDIIRRRIDTRGVIEPSVRVNGNQISVEIPGEQNIKDLEALITTSATLEFNQVKFAPPQDPVEGLIDWQEEIQYIVDQFPDLRTLVSKIVITEDFDFIYIEKDNLNAFKEAIMYKKNHPTFANEKIGYFKADDRFNIDPLLSFNEGDFWIGILNSQKPGLKGDNISNAQVQSNERLNTGYVISLEFDDEASTKWENYTGSNIGKQVAITLDNEVLTYPTIQSRISGASQITGFDSYEKAENIAIALNNGKFNLPLQIDSEYKSGPELGEKMINLGALAFIIGIICVIIFMIIYYKMSGLIAASAVIINILLMSAILSLLGATLTLPGIAGFILTVGIAVDANVIIFERIKEEIRKGTPPLSAIDAGYDRAFITILDANITTILTAFILYFFGTGPIKGFAITLSAGILCSMFTAIYITRTIYGTLYYSKFPKKLSI